MEPVTVLLGLACLAFGLLTAFLRIVRPQQLGKLEPMQRLWGPRLGTLIHWLSYTIAPLALGALLVQAGLQGRSVF
ncbi:MAG: hypothetical protein AB1758_34115 [Candidatus Eremiobacterota bacterium]